MLTRQDRRSAPPRGVGAHTNRPTRNIVAAVALGLLAASCAGQAKQAQEETFLRTYYYLTSSKPPREVADCINRNANKHHLKQGKVRTGSSPGSYDVLVHMSARGFNGLSGFYEIKPEASGSKIRAVPTPTDPLRTLVFKKKVQPFSVKAETKGCDAQLQRGELVEVPRSAGPLPQ